MKYWQIILSLAVLGGIAYLVKKNHPKGYSFDIVTSDNTSNLKITA